MLCYAAWCAVLWCAVMWCDVMCCAVLCCAVLETHYPPSQQFQPHPMNPHPPTPPAKPTRLAQVRLLRPDIRILFPLVFSRLSRRDGVGWGGVGGGGAGLLLSGGGGGGFEGGRGGGLARAPPPLVFAHQNVAQQVFFLLELGFGCKNRSFIPGGLLLIHGTILNFLQHCTTLALALRMQ